MKDLFHYLLPQKYTNALLVPKAEVPEPDLATGPVLPSASTLILDGAISSSGNRMFKREVNRLAAEESDEPVLLYLNSPGGAVDQLREAAQAVAALAGKRRVVAYTDSLMASAAYFLASQATEIYASEMSMVGSIGVVVAVQDYSEAFANAGIKTHYVDTGEYKSSGAMGKEVTEKDLEYIKGFIDTYFDDFVDHVAEGRGLDREKVLESADGKVFFAADAAERGLIDGVKSLEEIMEEVQPPQAPAARYNKGKYETWLEREKISLLADCPSADSSDV